MTPEQRARMDAALIRTSREQPDSMVGVLIRTTRRVGADERAALDSVGLGIGSVAGQIVTGRIRAGAVPALARLAFVAYLEQARTIPLARPPDVRIDTGGSDEAARRNQG